MLRRGSSRLVGLITQQSRHHLHRRPAVQLLAGAGSNSTTSTSSYSSVRTLATAPAYEVVTMPALSPTMETGTIIEWTVPPGDEVAAGSLLCEVETDKATVGFEFQDDAIVAKYLVEAGSEVAVGTPVAITIDDADDFPAFQAADEAGLIVVAVGAVEGGAAAAAASEAAPAAAQAPAAAAAAAPVAGRTVPIDHLLMPSASHLSNSKGIDVTALVGTGKGGRITKGDILLALAAGTAFPPLAATATASAAPPAATTAATAAPAAAASAPAAASAASVAASAGFSLPSMPPPLTVAVGDVATTGAPGEDEKPSTMRKVIAKRLTESKSTVPHCYVSVDCELDNLMAFRKKLAAEHDVKVSVNDLIIRSAGLALRDVPEMNASFDAAAGKPLLNDSVDISVAVATPGGLITPIVTGVDKRGLSDITETVRELAGRAREGKLQPHEFQGGTFSVSNLGMFGVSEFSAVINPPQAVIMAVGGGVRTVKPGLQCGGEPANPEPRVATVMTARISCDRRVGDEALASQFLQAFQSYMSKPQLLLM